MTDIPLLPVTGKDVLKLFPAGSAASDEVRDRIDSLIGTAARLNAHLIVDRDLHDPDGPLRFIVVRGDTRYGPLSVTRAELETPATAQRLREWIESVKETH